MVCNFQAVPLNRRDTCPRLLPLLLPMSGNVIVEVMSHLGQCKVNALVMWINTQGTCVYDSIWLCVREKYFHLI